jgi:hypothetical protein
MDEHRGRSWSATMFAFFPFASSSSSAPRRRHGARRRARLLAATALVAAVPAACSGDGGPSLGPFEGDATPNATVTVDGTAYAFLAQCYDDGQVFEARGVTVDAKTGAPVRMLVRIAPRESYVGLVFGDNDFVIEPSLDEGLVLTREGDRVRGDGIAFVRDLDFRTQTAAPAGTGSLLLDCPGVTPGSPPPS